MLGGWEFLHIRDIVSVYYSPSPLGWKSLLLNFRFGLLWFNSISTVVDYLMPNPFDTYISNISKKVNLAT